MSHPNIVLVITDDQGLPPLGSSGHPYVQTPHLDAFHAESVRFTDFHSGTTCAPTRAGLLTGHHCNSTGVWHTIGGRSLLREDEWTLAEALAGAGYHTGHFGKWHLGDTHPYRPQDRGFHRVVCHGGGGIGQQPDFWGNDYFDDTYMVDGRAKEFSGYCTDVFFEEALGFIRDHGTSGSRASEPFFAYISTNAPHGPFNVARKYRDLYTDATSSDAYARFLGMITNIDENFGRLRATLEESGLTENTIVLFMSDNGQTGLGEEVPDMHTAGMRGLKGSPYEGGHHVPCFIQWPDGGVSGGRDVDTLAAYVDVMPTLLDLAGIAVPPERSFHGSSLAPLARPRTGSGIDHDAAAAALDQRIITVDTQRVPNPIKWRLSCVMKGKWRLVHRTELYDLESDPGQNNNVYESRPELVAELESAYEEWWELCRAQMDRAIPQRVGDDGSPTLLLTHDIRNDDGDAVWNQGQVRAGAHCLGWWELDVRTSGTYEFALRRWPEEAGHAVQAGIDGDDVDWDREGVMPAARGWFTGGVALPWSQATLMVSDGVRLEKEIEPEEKEARFRVPLEAGEQTVRAIFSSPRGDYASAYYVYVSRVEEPE